MVLEIASVNVAPIVAPDTYLVREGTTPRVPAASTDPHDSGSVLWIVDTSCIPSANVLGISFVADLFGKPDVNP